ncbi:MAG TPA: hypothetical protein VLZ03_16245 [Thermodesulfobacteriota bacterium]|nr:hypothetical protein [Thermodesulfobacteriota bacterium]
MRNQLAQRRSLLQSLFVTISRSFSLPLGALSRLAHARMDEISRSKIRYPDFMPYLEKILTFSLKHYKIKKIKACLFLATTKQEKPRRGCKTKPHGVV